MGKIVLNGRNYTAPGMGGGSGNGADRNIYGDTFVSMGRKEGTDIGEYSFAFGRDCNASGRLSHAEGYNVRAINTCTHAEGSSASASGHASHAEGDGAKASGHTSHAEGRNTEAIGEVSHAEGDGTIALGDYSHAEGKYTAIGGDYSHAEGAWTEANGDYSHAEGKDSVASNYASHVSGKYNKIMTGGGNDSNQFGDVFVIGNGTGYSNLSNALRVTYQGDILGTKAFQSSGADYAEFIKPWADGNPDNEDRVGYFVTVRGGLLHIADEGDYIAGIVSGNPSIVGNADEDYYWRYERDAFNRIVLEDVPEQIHAKDQEGNPLYDPETHKPVMAPTGNIIKNARMKLAEGYDPSLQNAYIERKDRKEWDYVGMLGVLPIRDDGTCVPGQFCKCGQGGVATPAASRGFDTYLVIERISDTIVSVILK